jgi:hypothetical protein
LAGEGAVTVDEELNKLEDEIRRLKIEYEVYFNGGSQRLPQDMVFRIEKVIKRYSADVSQLSFRERFRFNSLVMKYTIQNELWKKKIREKEEGRGRFAPRAEAQAGIPGGSIRIVCSDPDKEKDKVDQLLKAMVQAKRQVGERIDNIDPLAFSRFVREKTQQIKESLGCEKVLFSISVENGKVKFKAAKAE